MYNHSRDDAVKLSQGPMTSDIVEQNINRTPVERWVRRLLFILIVILLVVFYFFPQQFMLGSL